MSMVEQSWFERARAAHREGRLEDAENAYRQAWRENQSDPAPAHLLGLLLIERQEYAAAAAILRQAVKLAPQDGAIQNTLAHACLKDLRHEEAETAFRNALHLEPNRPDYAVGLASLLHDLGRSEEAVTLMRGVVAASPGNEAAEEALGTLCAATGALEEAVPYLTRAVLRQPDNPDLLLSLAGACKDLGRPEEAEPLLRRALALRPGHPTTEFNLGYVLMLLSTMQEGYALYEARWHRDGRQPRPFPCPRWEGQDTQGQTILLWAEQGMGDTLQFARYLPVLARRHRIVVEVDQPLVRLIRHIPGIISVVPRGATLPHYDLHCPLLSLPHVMNDPYIRNAEPVPYLSASSADAAQWKNTFRQILSPRPGDALIGLCWAGSIRDDDAGHQHWNAQRSLPLSAFAAFCQLPGAHFVSLQKGPPAQEAKYPPAGMNLLDPTVHLSDFEDTAALIMALDLVMTVDTSVAHLAGALGKPVLMLNRFTTDWRWRMHGTRTAWYPSMRIVRQPTPGDWETALGEARSILTRFLCAFRNGDADPLHGSMESGSAPETFPA
ncbi:Tetratricopeptide repeat family protein [Granulibacter bethesdensis]|nr:Tetratricopeptide repeat family protein [Granulibacter bethesdensis]